MYAGTWYYNKFQCCEPRNPVASVRYRKRAKCSVRQRPKSDWLPLALPEALRIIGHDRWERVQQQLARNISFSPRNEKRAHLLKSLVRCGGCGATYVGESCHGKFYYRCHRRCKKVRTVLESALNEAVKGAVRDVIINPAVILEPLQKLDQAEALDKGKRAKIGSEIEKEAKQIETEEQRILDAYRTGVISPAQLGRQLEKVKARRTALDLRRTELPQQSSASPEQVKTAVKDYCAEAAKNLDNFTDEQWREFLRIVVRAIIFHGEDRKSVV